VATLAHLYYRCGRYDDAVSAFETAIAMEPDNWALVDDEVEVLVQSGQVREAVERLYGLLETQGPFADLHLRLAQLLSDAGQDDEAMRHYLAALEADPDYLEAKIGLGTHHLSNGRWDEAAEAFCQAAETNDRLLTCYVGLGAAQIGAGRRQEAISSFQLAAAVEPNSTLLLKEMARLQLKAAAAGEFEKAMELQQDLPAAEPDLDRDDLLQLQLARHAEEVGRQPEYADLRYRYGVLLRAEGRLGEALEQLEEAVRINPTYVAAIIRLGVTQQELGQIEQAIETFQRALDLKREYVDLHYRLAVLYTDRRQMTKAVEHMEQAAGLAPGNPQFRASLALALQNMGLMDRVAATWRSLAELHRNAGGSRHEAG
jgi:tetratricopeptide (TPR) repeat protein